MTSRTQILYATSEGIDRAVEILSNGGIVALPTETVYGLAARADNPEAIKRVFAMKSRPAINPLICHVSELSMAQELVEWNATAKLLAENFWPGALTMVLPHCKNQIVDEVSAGLDSLAIRMPNHSVMLQVIARLGVPLAAPSANRSGRLSPTLAKHVLRDLDGLVDAIIDDGACQYGLESTVVMPEQDGVQILRQGAIATAQISQVVQCVENSDKPVSKPISPGQLLRHYAPKTPLELNADDADLGFGHQEGRYGNLSQAGDLSEAAHHLFAMLDRLDGFGLETIKIAPIPMEGLGVAINDRLTRAARAVVHSK